MEDLQSTYSSAIQTLRESVEYGVAMFPDTGGDNEEGTEAADEVVKERARVRRKQLLEEETEIQQRESSEMEVEFELSKHSSPPKPVIPKNSRSRRGRVGTKSVIDTSESERDTAMGDWDEPQILTQRPPTAKSRKPTSGYRSDASKTSNASVANRKSTRSTNKNRDDTHTTQHLDPPAWPSPQPTQRRQRASSYRAKTPSDGSSDVEVISDHNTRSTRSRTQDWTKLVPQPSLKDSETVGEGSKKPALAEATLDTDSDDDLLSSSPFNVRRHISQRTVSTGLEDLDMEETPKLQKILNASHWGVLKTPTRQAS